MDVRPFLFCTVLALVGCTGGCGGDNPSAPTGPPDSDPTYTEEIVASRSSVMSLCVTRAGDIFYTDYFNNTIGILDPKSGLKLDILTNLHGPQKIRADEDQLYFVEKGTSEAGWYDGCLSVYDLKTKQVVRLLENLRAPSFIYIDSAGLVYFTQDGWGQTPGGNYSPLCRYDRQSGTVEVIIERLVGLSSAFLISESGEVYAGTWGGRSPGDQGELYKYPDVNSPPIRLLTNLPAVHDMAWGPNGDILLAGFGADDGSQVAIATVSLDHNVLTPLAEGHQSWCLALHPSGDIYFATGRLENAIRVLRRSHR